MLFVVLTLIGLYSFKSLSIQDFPDLDLPQVIVTASLPGAEASQIEIEITRKIEDSVANIDRLDDITSVVADGVSTTNVFFKLDKSSQVALDEVRDAISRIRSQLPSDMPEPTVSKITASSTPILTYAVSDPTLSMQELSWLVDNNIAKALTSVKGVATVSRQGGVSREFKIELDPTRLASLGISVSSVYQQLNQSLLSVSSGKITQAGIETTVKTEGSFQVVADLGTTPISLPNGRQVTLGEIATISDGVSTISQAAYLGGTPVVGFSISRAVGENDLEVANRAKNAIKMLSPKYPTTNFTLVSTSTKRITDNYNSSMAALYEGAFLAVVVVFLFLRDWRATLVSAVALPLSVIPTFAAMYYLGFTLNTITLLALTLVIGVLVDDSIVEVENIVRHSRLGKSPFKAAVDAVQEIGLAVIATSLTLVAVFLPTAFMGGVPGKIFFQFGWTAAIAVLVSLLVARLLTPMLAAYFLKPSLHEATPAWMSLYLKVMRTCLRNPVKTLGVTVVVTGMAIWAASGLPSAFMPKDDRGLFRVTLELTPGSSIQQTTQKAQEIYTKIKHIPEIANIYTVIGGASESNSMMGAGAVGSVRKASITVTLVDTDKRNKSQQDIEVVVRAALANIPGVRTSISSGGPGDSYSFVLASNNSEVLAQVASTIESEIRQVPGLGATSSTASLTSPELMLKPNYVAVAEQGISSFAIAQAVRLATFGEYSHNLPKVNLPERQVPVKVTLSEHLVASENVLDLIKLEGKHGLVSLRSLVSLESGSAPAQISRYNRKQNITISVELNGAPLGEVASKVLKVPSLAKLHPDVEKLESGEGARMAELFGGFSLAMAAGILAVYIVLVLLFHDFLQPITIISAIPLAAAGAFGMLSVFGHSLSLPTLIGLIMLIGLVTKNSILLVDYAISARRHDNLDVRESLVAACSKRARPVIMTTLAMVAGMLPMAIGLGDNLAFRAPMAITVIGGLITSTLLSLVVVPVLFELMDKFKLTIFRSKNA